MSLCGSVFLFVCTSNQNFLFRLFSYKIIILSRVGKRIDIRWPQCFIKHAAKALEQKILKRQSLFY